MKRVRAHGDLADADHSRPVDRFAKQRVRFFTALGRDDVIRSLEVAGVDFIGIHEIHDLDRLRGFDRRGLEVVVGEDDEFAFRILISLDDLFPVHGLAFFLAYALVLNRRQVGLVQEAKAHAFLGLNGGVQSDGNVHEAERESPRPDWTHLNLHIAVNARKPPRARDEVDECNSDAINSHSTFCVERLEFSTNPKHENRARNGYSKVGIFD